MSRIELKADRCCNALFPHHFQCKRKHESLGNRLDGEGHGAIADFIDVAIDGDEAYPEMRRIRSLQLRDIVGDGAGIVAPEFFVAAGEESL